MLHICVRLGKAGILYIDKTVRFYFYIKIDLGHLRCVIFTSNVCIIQIARQSIQSNVNNQQS